MVKCTGMQILQPRIGSPTSSPGKLFWPLVDRGHPMDCWPWIGDTCGNGYARLKWEGVNMYAHRVAFMVSGGVLTPGLVVMHTCDNPPCCNPAHLRQDTYSANTRDAVAKGRWIQGGFGGAGRRKKFCKRGHPMSEAYVSRGGARHCRACQDHCRRIRRAARLPSPPRSPRPPASGAP